MLRTLSPLERTALLPLWARALEQEQARPIIRDELAKRLVTDLAPIPDGFAGAWKTHVGVAVRAHVIDEIARAFIAATPGGTIVTLGAGLDTRHERINAPDARWIDVDLPAMAAARRQILGERPGHRIVSGCLLEDDWIAEVPKGPPALVIAEGVFMFIPLGPLREHIARLATARPGTTVACDLIGTLMVRFPWLHDSLPGFDGGEVRFAWGIDRPRRLARWDGVTSATIHPMLAEAPDRWRWMRVLRHLPGMRDQFIVSRLDLGPGDRLSS